MSAKTVYQCDGPNCQQQRTESNHWFVVTGFGGKTKTVFQIEPWTDTAANFETDGARPLHLCGQHCVQKVVEKWLTTGKLS